MEEANEARFAAEKDENQQEEIEEETRREAAEAVKQRAAILSLEKTSIH